MARTLRLEWVEVDEERVAPARFFKEITQADRRVTIRGGRRTRGVDQYQDDGDDTANEHDTIAAASAYVADRVEYFKYTFGADIVKRDAMLAHYTAKDHMALEAECRAAPDDPAPWTVYADWLIAEGDVLGEIASRVAGGHGGDVAALIAEDRDALAGDNEFLPALVFRHGFVTGATFKLEQDERPGELADLVRAFLAAPLGKFVTSLRFGLAGHESNNDWAPVLRAITESRSAPHIRELRFDDYTRDDQEISWTAFGDFAFAWPQLPALELLHIKAGGGGTLGELHLPRLKTFIRESGGLPADELASIAKARWPALEHLEVWFGSSNYGAAGTIDSLRDILANDLPRLRHLGVVNCEFVDDVIPALAAWPRLAQLESLDLSKGVMHARATAALVANAKRFRHLASLDLSENLLEESQRNAIRAVLDNAIVNDQRDYDFEDGDDAEDFPRYVAVGE